MSNDSSKARSDGHNLHPKSVVPAAPWAPRVPVGPLEIAVILTPAQAAAILNVSAATVRNSARKGIILARKIGKHWRFLEADLSQAGVQNSSPLPLRIGGWRKRSETASVTNSQVARIARN